MKSIPEEFIKKYVDELLKFAGRSGPDSLMGKAAMQRADHAMDLVTAWRTHSETTRGTGDEPNPKNATKSLT